MTAYVRTLNIVAAEEQARQAERNKTEAQTARDRLSPLEDRLARLLATIPDEVQREGLSLPALQTAQRGRWRGRCHTGELGERPAQAWLQARSQLARKRWLYRRVEEGAG